MRGEQYIYFDLMARQQGTSFIGLFVVVVVVVVLLFYFFIS